MAVRRPCFSLEVGIWKWYDLFALTAGVHECGSMVPAALRVRRVREFLDKLASRILSAVATGERDPERLKHLALERLRNRDWFAEDR